MSSAGVSYTELLKESRNWLEATQLPTSLAVLHIVPFSLPVRGSWWGQACHPLPSPPHRLCYVIPAGRGLQTTLSNYTYSVLPVSAEGLIAARKKLKGRGGGRGRGREGGKGEDWSKKRLICSLSFRKLKIGMCHNGRYEKYNAWIKDIKVEKMLESSW